VGGTEKIIFYGFLGLQYIVVLTMGLEQAGPSAARRKRKTGEKESQAARPYTLDAIPEDS